MDHECNPAHPAVYCNWTPGNSNAVLCFDVFYKTLCGSSGARSALTIPSFHTKHPIIYDRDALSPLLPIFVSLFTQVRLVHMFWKLQKRLLWK